MEDKTFKIVEKVQGVKVWYWILANGNVSCASEDISRITDLAVEYPESYKGATLKFGESPW